MLVAVVGGAVVGGAVVRGAAVVGGRVVAAVTGGAGSVAAGADSAGTGSVTTSGSSVAARSISSARCRTSAPVLPGSAFPWSSASPVAKVRADTTSATIAATGTARRHAGRGAGSSATVSVWCAPAGSSCSRRQRATSAALGRVDRHHRGQQRRRPRREPLGDGRRAVQAGHGGLGGRPLEAAPTGERLQQDEPKRVDVCGRGDGTARHLLGRQVGGCADDLVGRGQADRGGIEEAGDAEVGESGRSVVGDQHVAGLDVAMHDGLAVGVSQRPGELRAERPHPLRRQRALPEQIREGGALDEVEHQERWPGVHRVPEAHDRGVIEGREHPGLDVEPLGVVDAAGPQDLDGHPLAGGAVGGGMDVGEPAAAQDRLQLVPAGEDNHAGCATPLPPAGPSPVQMRGAAAWGLRGGGA
jgi:hypothetical protein